MWHPAELLQEAQRNLGPRQLIAGVVGVAMALSGALALVDQAERSIGQERALRQAGSLVWAAEAPENSVLDGNLCSMLAQQKGIAASGGLTTERPSPMTVFPGGGQLPVAYVTSGMPQVFSPMTPPGQPTIGHDLLELENVSIGQSLVLPDGAVAGTLTEPLPAWVPLAALGSGVTLPTVATTPVSTCWIRMEPGAQDYGQDVMEYTFPGAAVGAFNPRSAELLSPISQWNALIRIHPGLVMGLLLGSVMALLTWSRRAELATYRTFGTTTGQLAAMLAAEYILVLIPTAAVALLLAPPTATLITSAPPSSTSSTIIVGSILATVASALATACVLAPLVTRGSLTAQLKDR